MVYEIELKFDGTVLYHNMPDEEVISNFTNIQSIKNERCSKFDFCFNYALDKISKKLNGEFLFGCMNGFDFLKKYFKQIPIEKVMEGDIITYHDLNDFKSQYEKPCAENCMHFAVIHSTDGTLENTVVHSKWGRLGVFRGLINDMPDMYGNAILIWRKEK